MKIRHGFVSNSSSSSFCLLGVNLKSGVTDEEETRIYEHDYLELENGLEDIDGVVVGMHPNAMLKTPNMTVREILEDLVADINSVLDNENPVTIDDIRVYSDQGYDS